MNIHRFKSEAAKIIYEDAKCRFDDLSKASDVIDTKANTLFGLLNVMIITSLGFLANRYPCIEYKDLIVQDAIALSLISMVSLIIVSRMLFPSKIKIKGTKPNFHINRPDFEDSWTDDETALYTLYDCIISLQNAISENESIHQRRVRKFKQACLVIAYGMPALVIWSLGFMLWF